MCIAIVGSRDYPDLKQVAEFVRSLPPGTVVVSGGAKGVDSAAATAAESCGLETDIHLPDYKRHGKSAPFVRNSRIVVTADQVVAFHYNKSSGTAHTIRLAKEAGKPVTVYHPRPTPDVEP